MYIVGIHGNGTKTKCVVGDEQGNVLSQGVGGPSDYDVYGEESTKAAIDNALNMALNTLNIQVKEISYAYLGLCGADSESDVALLTSLCKEIFKNVPFKVVNDSWISLKAGNDEYSGVVAICGLDGAVAGRKGDGSETVLRNYTFEQGGCEGGAEIVSRALHFAFRAEEKTCTPTLLETYIPEAFNLKSISEVDLFIRKRGIPRGIQYKILSLVSELARKGDRVSQDLFVDKGTILGEISGGVIKRLGLEQEEVKCTLVGCVFTDDNPLMIDAYKLAVHRTAPKAEFIISREEPVIGAYHLALESFRN